MSDEKKSVLLENLAELTTPDGIQKYILGTKKNGTPRALYDIFKDYAKPSKKKKKNKKSKGTNSYAFYLNTKSGKKKKKKKKETKHWHI